MKDVDHLRRAMSHWVQLDDDYRDDEWIEDYLTDDFLFRTESSVHVGKGAIRDLMKDLHGDGARGVHIISQPVIEIESSTAQVAAAILYVIPTRGDKYEISWVGRSSDRWIRGESGAWRCAARTSTELTTQ